MTAKPEQDTWKEVRDLLLRWEALTAELIQGAAGGPPERLLSLLKQRQQICERLDALRKGRSLADWIEEAGDCPAAIHEEIRTIIDRLALDDKRIRTGLSERVGVLEQKIEEVRKSKAAVRLYRGRRRTIKGAFIDTRR